MKNIKKVGLAVFCISQLLSSTVVASDDEGAALKLETSLRTSPSAARRTGDQTFAEAASGDEVEALSERVKEALGDQKQLLPGHIRSLRNAAVMVAQELAKTKAEIADTEARIADLESRITARLDSQDEVIGRNTASISENARRIKVLEDAEFMNEAGVKALITAAVSEIRDEISTVDADPSKG